MLFADIRGFTTRCETMAPEEAMAFLRDFHARMEAVIFEHGGTLDKILGDGLLAVFGVPDLGNGDAGDALACAFAMMEAVGGWNTERAGRGEADVQIGVGLHYGHVMLGDVGSERLMTFTVVGDTVNVASRLQSLSKELGTRLVASEALVNAVKDEMRKEGSLLGGLKFVGAKQLRGREHETVVYALDGAGLGAAAWRDRARGVGFARLKRRECAMRRVLSYVWWPALFAASAGATYFRRSWPGCPCSFSI